MKLLKFLVLHCTASPEGREVTSDEIRIEHLSAPPKGRGWKQVGYADMIHLDGRVENLVPHNDDAWVDPREITNGVLGLNDQSRSIVYVGGVDKKLVPKDTRTGAQQSAMAAYIHEMIRLHPDIKICGHNQWANKACPSFDVPKWCRQIGVAEKNIYTK